MTCPNSVLPVLEKLETNANAIQFLYFKYWKQGKQPPAGGFDASLAGNVMGTVSS